MKDTSIPTAYLRQALEGARASGYDIKRLLKEHGIPPRLLEEERARIGIDPFVQLQQRLFSLMNDEGAGLLEKPQRLGTFGLIAKAALTCQNLDEVLRHFKHAYNLFENGFYHNIREQDGNVIYSLQRRSHNSVRNKFMVEFNLMTLHRFICWLFATRVELLSVSLDYPAPSWENEYRSLFSNASMRFKQHEICMVFRKADMSLLPQRDISALNDYLQRAPRDIFTISGSATLSQRIRREMVRNMRYLHGMPSIETVAQSLEIHPQTLRRRLKQENTDFTEIRTQVRRDVAIYLLSSTDNSVEKIALILGFSEASPFIRAFKDWMGMTPLGYRQI